jgi:hypothetical protein
MLLAERRGLTFQRGASGRQAGQRERGHPAADKRAGPQDPLLPDTVDNRKSDFFEIART